MLANRRSLHFGSALLCTLVCVLGLVLASQNAYAAIAVTPAYVEVKLDQGRPAGQFTISNIGDEEERYRIGALHFIFSKDGALQASKPDEHSLAPWIKFNPPEFTLAPKTQRVIRFVIVPQGTLKPGEYWAAMELESLKENIALANDGKGRELKLKVISSVLVPMFGTVGTVQHAAAIKEVRMSPMENGQKVEFMINNAGAGKLVLQGKYSVKNSAGRVVGEGTISSSYILPASDRFVPSAIKEPLENGTYTIHVECESKQLAKPLINDFQVVWKAPSVAPQK